MKWQTLLAVGLLAGVIIASLGPPGPAGLKSENWDVPKGLPEYLVVRVIDGDTIEVEKLGRVRYIGMDTPETKHPSKPVEWMGKEASDANRKLVEGKKVKLEFDAERHDRYGRTLAYVYVGTVFVNAWLVEAGYAQLLTVPPNVKFADLFVQLQREAREAKRGLWADQDDADQDGAEHIYHASKKSDKFHYPWCASAKKIAPANLIVFHDRQQALDSGYLPCKTCKP